MTIAIIHVFNSGIKFFTASKASFTVAQHPLGINSSTTQTSSHTHYQYNLDEQQSIMGNHNVTYVMLTNSWRVDTQLSG